LVTTGNFEPTLGAGKHAYFGKALYKTGAHGRAVGTAGFGFKMHPHMLRHTCGFALASKGHDTRAFQAYLGHKNI
jgi:integrase